MTTRELHPRLQAWLERRNVEILARDGKTIRCRMPHEGGSIDFRVEHIRKRQLTKTEITKRLEIGVDAAVWDRISTGQRLIAVHVVDTDSMLIQWAAEIGPHVRRFDGDGGGTRRTEGGGMCYWPVARVEPDAEKTLMRSVLADGSSVDWDDPIALRERGAVLRQRELDAADVEEHEGQRAPEAPNILELLSSN